MALGISEMKLTFLVPETAGRQFSEVWEPITNVRPWEDRRFYPHEETGKIPHEE